MNKDDFVAKFRGRLLLFITEAWAVRKESPQSLGLLMDDHARQLKMLLNEMFDSMHQPAKNGTPNKEPVQR